MPTHPVYRAARAVVFATVCTALAITGHGMASHASVPPAAVAGGLAVMTTIGITLAGAERRLATILGMLLGGQFVLHAIFAAAHYGQHLGHGGGAAASSGGRAMTLAHVAAAAISAWWLRRGERAVWSLARRVAAAVLRPALAPLSVPRPPSAAPRPRSVPPGAARPRPALLRHVVVRRGPPSPRAALA
jgi:hypothetical protein